MRKHHYFAMCLLLTVLSLVYTVANWGSVGSNFVGALVALWDSMVMYFRFIFFLEVPPCNPITPPSYDTPNILPTDPTELGNNVSQFFGLLFCSENFGLFAQGIGALLLSLVRVLPFVIALIFLFKRYYRQALSTHNNDYNRDTRALRVFKAVSTKTYVPIRRYLLGLFGYIQQGKFPKLWLMIWLFNLNIFAVLLLLIATVLFFSISFNFVALYYFLYSSLALAVPAFLTIPIFVWIVLALWLIDRWRKKQALRKLRHMEGMNKTFILDRSICTMLVGTMGTGKTTLITDISLSTEAIFRNKAYELTLEIDLKFPNFPWINLENELKVAMKKGAVFNLASCGEWVKSQEQAQNHFGYDYQKHGLYYDDKKTMTYLFDALKDYAKLYFIYIINSSLILSNYAVRTDFKKIDLGNMPMWNLDFFERKVSIGNIGSRYSKVLDFDMLRLGKKLVDNNKSANAFEFGVIAITEIGKERGNQFKDQEIKETIKQLRETIRDLDKVKAESYVQRAELERLTTRATHLTDKFNDSLKLIRHKCTVAGFPFARVYLDEQRPESLGADARDLCEIVHIRDKSDIKLAMPFYFVGELIYAFIFPKFHCAYHEYRFSRGDNTLLMYTLKKIGSTVHQSYRRTYNRFGYHIRTLAVEEASTGIMKKPYNYFLSTKKIYSDRFSTDAYADIFAHGLKSCKVGLDQIPEYASSKATEQELKSQNSYFINEITKNK